jgi:hypothetical protein
MANVFLSMSLCLLMASASVSAGTPGTLRSEARGVRQQARIVSGVMQGDLTAPEARRLHRGQRRVDVAQGLVRADGVATAGEQRRLDRMQQRQSLRIAAQRRDAQRRGD